MTREEAMLKLLAIEPERFDRIAQITGWGADATRQVLQDLLRARRIASITGPGECGRTYYLPGVHDEHVQQLLSQREQRDRSRRGAAGRAIANNRRILTHHP